MERAVRDPSRKGLGKRKSVQEFAGIPWSRSANRRYEISTEVVYVYPQTPRWCNAIFWDPVFRQRIKVALTFCAHEIQTLEDVTRFELWW
jgi:hypothetical protein